MAALVILLAWAPSPAHAETKRYGTMFDLGFPDAAMASFAYRARPQLMPHVGLGYNANSVGLRVGGRWTFLPGDASPFFALDAGNYFQANTPTWMRKAAKDYGLKDKTMQRVGYQFASGHLGFGVGSGDFQFYMQAGISFVRANALIIKPKPKYLPPVDLYRDTTVNLWLVSGRLGVLYFF
jgi:hypothetical protein